MPDELSHEEPPYRRPARLQGMGRCRQCRHGKVFLAAAKGPTDPKRLESHEELRLASVVWIEKNHHRCRRQRRLDKLAPIEVEKIRVTPQPV